MILQVQTPSAVQALDLSGDFEGFRVRLDDFVEKISKLVSISIGEP